MTTGAESSLQPVRLRECQVGANPIIWSNDDFPELNGDLPLDTILREMRAAGYAGTELGHAYPRTPESLGPILARHGLQLASGWHSTHLASRPLVDELQNFEPHIALLKALGAPVAIVAECTRCIHGTREAALGFETDSRPTLTETEWTALIRGMKALTERTAAAGLKLVYHHHMGTAIQRESDLDRLLGAVPELRLLLDPGHLAFAGIDPVNVAQRYARRIAHVHLKSVRPEIVARVRRDKWSFCRAVTEGVFTIPGEGSVDFPAIFRILDAANYHGWLIAEAEEDPAKAPPLPKARQARDYVRKHAGV
jgi:inosose dehydratase